ncbi:hypothetical protein H0H87_003628 [Tephrocybe sp. NHM501043]|nr:hypothetical protein H0H87_003628 [Tephrocybe sp. NHM501043]
MLRLTNLILLPILFKLSLALSHSFAREYNDGIHLAVRPKCGFLNGPTADVNAGLEPHKFKTIVAFGDSYTDGGHDDGGPLDPPVLVFPSSQAGGRPVNGFTWVELVAQDIGATLKDYAMQAAAHSLLNQIDLLAIPPTNARNFMVLDVYGRGTTAKTGEDFKQTVFSGLHEFHTRKNGTRLNVSYVDFANIWNGVVGPVPGHAAFGYTSTEACTKCTNEYGCSTIDMCSDPDHYFQWLPGYVPFSSHLLRKV